MSDELSKNVAEEESLYKETVNRWGEDGAHTNILKNLIERTNEIEEENALLKKKLKKNKEFLNWLMFNMKTIISKEWEIDFLLSVKKLLNN